MLRSHLASPPFQPTTRRAVVSQDVRPRRHLNPKLTGVLSQYHVEAVLERSWEQRATISRCPYGQSGAVRGLGELAAMPRLIVRSRTRHGSNGGLGTWVVLFPSTCTVREPAV